MFAVYCRAVRTVAPSVVLTEEEEITEGEDCRFEAVVAGKPEPTVTW